MQFVWEAIEQETYLLTFAYCKAHKTGSVQLPEYCQKLKDIKSKCALNWLCWTINSIITLSEVILSHSLNSTWQSTYSISTVFLFIWNSHSLPWKHVRLLLQTKIAGRNIVRADFLNPNICLTGRKIQAQLRKLNAASIIHYWQTTSWMLQVSIHFFIQCFRHDEENIYRGGVPCLNQSSRSNKRAHD